MVSGELVRDLPGRAAAAPGTGSFNYAETQRSNRCMRRGMPPWERLGRQVIRMQRRDCCYYHGVDWRRVAAEAVRIAREVPLAAQTAAVVGGR